nr:hypothetical protein [Flavobacterium sp. ASV13]
MRDRIERPKKFKFIFNDETLDIDSTDDRLQLLNDKILNKEKQIVEVNLTYNTGEIITVKCNGNNWTSIQIFSNNKSFEIPVEVLSKIKEIHFLTLNLLWSGENDAVNSSYFYIRFDMGMQTNYNKLPYLQLLFSNQKFSNAEIYRQISDYSSQCSPF